jgi:hypothetical protein
MRKILYIALFSVLAVSAKAQIPINTFFDVSTPNPIDGRFVIPTLSDTSFITDLYDGLLTVVQNTDQLWQYDGTKWVQFQTGISDNIYTANGTISANRTVTVGAGNSLNITTNDGDGQIFIQDGIGLQLGGNTSTPGGRETVNFPNVGGGLQYGANYSTKAGFGDRTIPDWGYISEHTVDTLSSLSDTTAAANNVGRIAHVVDVDQKWTVNSAGSWEVLSASRLSDNIREYFFTFDEAKLIDGDTLSNEFPNITYNPSSGRLVMIYRKATDHAYAPGGKTVSRYSDDEGTSWSGPVDVFNLGGNFDSGPEPTIFWDDSTSQYIAAATVRQSGNFDSIPEYILVSRSDDGMTWALTDTIGNPDTDGAFRMSNNFIRDGSRLINNAFTLYQDSTKLYFMESIDDGETWNFSIIDNGLSNSDGPTEGQIVFTTDTLFLFNRGFSQSLHRYYSTDNGATWSSRVNVTPDNYNGTKPMIEVIDNVMVMTHRESSTSAPVVSLSYDNGMTWTENDPLPYRNGDGQMDYSDLQKINNDAYYHVYSQNDNIRGQLYLRGIGHEFNDLTEYRHYTRGSSGNWRDGSIYDDPLNHRYWFGGNAGSDSTNSTQQIAIGREAGRYNTEILQIALGTWAGRLNTGDNQIAIGSTAGMENTAGDQIAIGTFTGRENEGFRVAQIGFNAARFNKGDYQVAIGTEAGYYNQGNHQIAIGYRAGRSVLGVNNPGIDNIFIGQSSGFDITEGNGNVALGAFSLFNLTGGDHNIAIGHSAGNTLINANNTISIGRQTNTTTDGEIRIGNANFYSNTVFPQKLTLENMLVLTPIVTANEPTPTEGGMYYNADENEVKISKDGLAFEPLVPKDTLIYTFPIMPYNGTDTIFDGIGFEEYFTTVTPDWANRKVVAFEITTTDTVSTNLYLQLYEENITAGISAQPIPPTTNFVLPQGQQSVRFTTADTEIPSSGIEFSLGRAMYAAVTNGSAAGSSSYVATEGPNGIYVTFHLIE